MEITEYNCWPHPQGLAPQVPVEARIIHHPQYKWIAIIEDRIWMVDWNGFPIPNVVENNFLVIDEHEGKDHLGKDYYVKIIDKGSPSLLQLLSEAEEFHDLTVVRMAMKDLTKYQSDESALERLRVDMDKMRMAQTDAGKCLYEYAREKLGQLSR